jgi:hypothetical protein
MIRFGEILDIGSEVKQLPSMISDDLEKEQVGA